MTVKDEQEQECRPAVYTLMKDLVDGYVQKSDEAAADGDSDLEKKVLDEIKKLKDSRNISLYGYKYEELPSKLAFLTLHFTQHAYIVNSILSDSYAACTNIQSQTTVFNELMRSIDWGRLSVFSFGGGPAPDVFGVLMFLHRFGFNTLVQASSTDACKSWEGIAQNLFKKLQFEGDDDGKSLPNPQQKYTHNLWKKIDGGIRFFHASLKSPGSFFNSTSKEMIAIKHADIVTLPFVLSSVFDAPETSNALQYVLDSVKPGALVVYVDHPEGKQTELINNLSYWCGLRRVYFMKEMHFSMPKYEDPEILQSYTVDIDKALTRTFKVTAIVFKKPSGYSYDRRMRMSRREVNNIRQAQIRLKKSNPDFKLFRPGVY